MLARSVVVGQPRGTTVGPAGLEPSRAELTGVPARCGFDRPWRRFSEGWAHSIARFTLLVQGLVQGLARGLAWGLDLAADDVARARTTPAQARSPRRAARLATSAAVAGNLGAGGRAAAPRRCTRVGPTAMTPGVGGAQRRRHRDRLPRSRAAAPASRLAHGTRAPSTGSSRSAPAAGRPGREARDDRAMAFAPTLP